MSSLETRNVARDSLFLFAELTFEGQPDTVKVKVRNLSAGGMMAEGGAGEATRGDRLVIELRNVGSVKGNVAWVQGNRFGIAFETEVDPKIVRAPVGTGESSPRFTRPVLANGRYADEDHQVRSL
ncbi:PilZ domain-containing protein [Qipengyuania flava]|uniref:PilZ domain-containing protein n=1 Tax=Qipengyuania flava TaxID=192812 RepID=UPI001C62D097|nr:PilZ domain-containing protein [Qipengyuania flava]QYJ07129.1 PilZ domain-containing protein [Qipengyuania flava]